MREWDRFYKETGFQADRTIKKFTPTWSGFSSPPSFDFFYYDFGAIVYIWPDPDSLTTYGTSNAATFATTGGMPAEIIPITSSRHVISPGLVDNGSPALAAVTIQPSSGNMIFECSDVDGSAGGTDAYPFSINGWTAAGTKGVGGAFIISYVK